MLVNPKRSHEVEPTLHSVYPNDRPTQMKVLEYAGHVAREMAFKKEILKDPNEETRTSIELPQLYMQLLKLAGHDMPHKNGTSMGVQTVIRLIVAQFLLSKFPLQREQILKLRKKQ